MPAPRLRTARAALLLALTTTAHLACSGSGGGGGGTAPSPRECFRPENCAPAPTLCYATTCSSGLCEYTPLAAGSVVGGDPSGNCRIAVCDGAGGVTSAPWDADLPSTGSACASPACSGGAPSSTPIAAGTPCQQDGGSRCDGAGLCVQCLAASDCPGADTECGTRTCTAGVCGVTAAPYATPLAAQAEGDCREWVCDGLGGTTFIAVDTDVPADDGSACTVERCAAGVAAHAPVAAGTACTGANGGVVCDAAGACVQCLSADACPGLDTPCAHPACTAGACGTAFVTVGTPLPTQVAGDCRQDVCDGAGAVTSVTLATDVPVDADPCTQGSCAGGVPSNPPAPAGTACAVNGGTVCDGAGVCVSCNVGADCASGVCAGHACQAPTCGDGVRNGAETSVDCGGETCPSCADGARCALARDCSSGVCTGGTCRAPTCIDAVRNGAETDVDCGGPACAACGRDRACLADRDCASGICRAGACGGPVVSVIAPADGATDVAPGTAITVSFSRPVFTSTVTAQAASGPCSGSVQLSSDGFATCIGLAAISVTGASAALQPATPLARATTYRIRTTNALIASGAGSFEPFETPAGFTTAGGNACGGALVISQIYAHGGLTGAAYAKDFVELHNNGNVPVRLDGLSVQSPSVSSTWNVTPLSGTIPAGGYYLVQEAGGTAAIGAPLPAPDATGAIDLFASGGRVVLASTTMPFVTTACPSLGVLDLVGYGGTTTGPTTCREGTAAAAIPDAAGALARAGGGCADGNGNALDLALQLAVPRNAASTPAVCGCNGTPVNGMGFFVEMDLCSVRSPLGLTVAPGAPAGPVYGRVFETGITDPFGPPPALVAQLGFGPAGTDPRWAAGWTFVPATWSAQVGNDDEFGASFTAPAAGSWIYAYRLSPDGRQWTYCDPNGAGSSPGNPFEPNSLPSLTVTAP